jgi:hypothetical protein
MKGAAIHLGFEVPTGEAVSVPLRHMAVTGQTQESGKTTTLEALITRSSRRALAFITKRGEASFTTGRQIAPFFRERADWEFVESILESSMKQKMRFERSWIVRACEGASSLRDVQQRAGELQEQAKGAFNQDMFMLLGKYLEKVVPLVERLPKAPRLVLEPGLNVMNLLAYPEELQALVVASSIRWVYEHEREVVTLIPEAWKFIPQGRKSPVQAEVKRLAREGAALSNFVWIDSQDMAGVEKEILRACSVWLIGVQREQHELKRALDAIPAGVKKPRSADVAQLSVGEFFASFGRNTHHTYVQPAWMSEETARRIARGELSTADVEAPARRAAAELPPAGKDEALMPDAERLAAAIEELTEAVRGFRPLTASNTGTGTPVDAEALARDVLSRLPKTNAAPPDLDELARLVAVRLTGDGALMQLSVEKPEIEVRVKREIIRIDGATLPGRIALLVKEGFFDQPKGHKSVWAEVQRRGFTGSNNVQRELERLAERGFLTREQGLGFKSVEGMKVNVVEE